MKIVRHAAHGPAVQSGSKQSSSIKPYHGAVPGARGAPAPASPTAPPSTGGEQKSDPPPVGNAAFVEAVFASPPAGAAVAVCSKRVDPERGGWLAMAADRVDEQCPPTANNYLNASSFYRGDDGSVKARKERFAGLHFVLLDDLGTKVSLERLAGFEPTWLIESSPGNYQAGFVLDPPVADLAVAAWLINALIGKGLCDPGAGGVARWVRLPFGINGKAKYRGKNGAPIACRLVHMNPECRYSVHRIVAAFGLDLSAPEPGIAERQRTVLPPPSSMRLRQIAALLDRVDPDIGYADWLAALMAVHSESGGSYEGLELADRWSSRGKKYRGRAEIESKWRSFRLDVPRPRTLGTLVHLVRQSGADPDEVLDAAGPQFEPVPCI